MQSEYQQFCIDQVTNKNNNKLDEVTFKVFNSLDSPKSVTLLFNQRLPVVKIKFLELFNML